MRIRSAYVPCLALLLVCCHATAAGQRRRGTPARRGATTNAPPPAAPTTARGPAWSITKQPFNEDSQATTLVSIEPMPTAPAADGQSPLAFGVNFAYEGDTPAEFKNAALNFFARGKDCRFAPEPAIVLNLDNRPLTLPYRPRGKGADGVFWVESVAEGGECGETVIAYVSPATLEKIATARSVTGRIGRESFRLSPDNLAALRALLAELRLPQVR